MLRRDLKIPKSFLTDHEIEEFLEALDDDGSGTLDLEEIAGGSGGSQGWGSGSVASGPVGPVAKQGQARRRAAAGAVARARKEARARLR